MNGVTIESRASDNFVNATQLCKAGKKNFNDWYRQDTTKKLIQVLETHASETGINGSLVEIKKGGLSHTQGSWVHPDLAIQLAQWISPLFALQVSRWIRELLLTGYVDINSTKTDEELKSLEKELFEARKTIQIKDQRELEHKEELQRAEQALKEAERRQLKLQEFIKSTAKLETKEVIYIGTSDAYQRQNRFKVGGCSSPEALIARFSNYNSGRPSEDPFFCARFWAVHSYTMVEKIAKTLLAHYKDNQSKAGEDYHIHGGALADALDFIVQNSSESVDWFNEHFQDFTERTISKEPSTFEPIQLRQTLYISAGDHKVDIVDITGWPKEKIEAEIQEILAIYQARKNLPDCAGETILWKDLADIIKERHRKPRMTVWRCVFKEAAPRRSTRLRIKGLGM